MSGTVSMPALKDGPTLSSEREALPPPAGSRKIGLDLVRAFAIALVVLSHFFNKAELLGVLGVEIFFALSGFLIGGILYRRLLATDRWSFAEVRRFWLRRWWRTLPNYYLFLLVAIPFHRVVDHVPLGQNHWPFLIFAQNLCSGNHGFYGVSWSLCVEEFTVVYPSCLTFTICVFTWGTSQFSWSLCLRNWSYLPSKIQFGGNNWG